MAQVIRKWWVALAVVLSSWPLGSRAALIPDGQLWVQALLSGRAGESFRYVFEVQPRINSNFTNLGSVIVRPGLGYRLNERQSVWLGYGWIGTWVSGMVRSEHRIWQQYLHESKWDEWTLIHRGRFEQRFMPGGDGTPSLRLRYMARVLRALNPESGDPSWSAVAWDEIMFNLNSATAGPLAGFDQNRAFLGIQRRLGALTIEGGYLNNWVRGSTDDRMNHTLFAMVGVAI